MFKPDSLRAHLVAAIPELARDPDKLLVFIDDGSIVSRLAPGLSFEYRYQLQLVLTDFAAHPDSVMVPLLTWLRVQQPELLANHANAERIGFQADILAHDKVDLAITLPLTERVGVHARPEGGHDVQHYPEPQLEPDLTATHWQIYLKGELIAEWDVGPAPPP